MKFKKYFLFVLLFLPIFSYAQVYINEIMYAPASGSGEWVEIFNSGNDSVDLSNWRFFNNEEDSVPLRIQKGSVVLSAGGYAIITTTPYVNSFSGTVFTSSQFSLPNDSSKYNTYKAISDSNKQIINSVTYNTTIGGDEKSGNSLQRQLDGAWIAATPTPGVVNSNIAASTGQIDNQNASTTDNTATTTNQTTQSNNSSGDSSSNSWSAISSPASLPNTETPIEFEISAGRDRLTTVGNDLLLVVKPIKLQGIVPNAIGYIWSFGDGTTGGGDTVHHTYKFAGDYSVVVNASASDKMAVDRLTVRVIDPKISLQKVFGGTQIANNSGSEINLEGWTLCATNKIFIFPKDTLVPPGRSVIFADDVTGISGGNLQLKNSLGKVYAGISDQGAQFAIATSTQSLSVDFDSVSAGISDAVKKVAELQLEINGAGAEIAGGAKPFAAKQLTAEIANNPSGLAGQVYATSSTGHITLTSRMRLQANVLNGASTSLSAKASEGTRSATERTVFVASSSPGFISRVFAWPIRGFNFLRGLFIEK